MRQYKPKNEKTTLKKRTQPWSKTRGRLQSWQQVLPCTKRAGQAAWKRKRDDSSPPDNYRDPDQGGQDRFREPKPRTEYGSRQIHPPQRGRGETKDRNKE